MKTFLSYLGLLKTLSELFPFVLLSIGVFFADKDCKRIINQQTSLIILWLIQQILFRGIAEQKKLFNNVR